MTPAIAFLRFGAADKVERASQRRDHIRDKTYFVEHGNEERYHHYFRRKKQVVEPVFHKAGAKADYGDDKQQGGDREIDDCSRRYEQII